jgi:lipoic acid synthetase
MERFTKPEWLKVKLQVNENYSSLRSRLRELKLHTICEEARCPNIFECWGHGTATVLLLGEKCTRACRFCAVQTGNPHGLVDLNEPVRVAEQAAESGLSYIVLTSVDRDDLPDGGASIIAKTVGEIKKRSDIVVEVLMPDFRGNRSSLDMIIDSGAEVLAHNIETVRRLTPAVRDRRAGYEQSLDVLSYLKKKSGRITKSSIMVGLGERREEVLETLSDLRSAGVDAVTIGQYLQPDRRHLEVQEYIHPELFKEYERSAYEMGFRMVASGPFVRSSYRAGEMYLTGMVKGGM